MTITLNFKCVTPAFVGNKKIANIANTYSGVVCLVSKGKTMKRESGAKPEQTHCRKLHYEAPRTLY